MMNSIYIRLSLTVRLMISLSSIFAKMKKRCGLFFSSMYNSLFLKQWLDATVLNLFFMVFMYEPAAEVQEIVE